MIALALALAVPNDKPNDQVVRAYILCVRRMAVKLEPSGESPADIADAAKARCTADRTAAINSSREIKGGAAISLSELEEGATFYAKAQVVVARLCRKTRDCSLNSIP